MAGIDTYTKLCLHGEGSDAATTFRDASPGHVSISRSGHTQIDTAQKKFGAASILFDGTDDYLTAPDSDNWYFGTGDFTIDLWVRLNAAPAYNTHAMLVSQHTVSGASWHFSYCNDAGTYKLAFDCTGFSVRRAVTLNTGTWYHVAVVRIGTTVKFFVGGSQVSTDYTTSGAVPNETSTLFIGVWYAAGGMYLNGWIDELRISKGIARWTSDFTPESAAYSIDDSVIEAVTISEDTITDPGLPTDAEITEDVEVTYGQYDVYFCDIDEDVLVSGSGTINPSYAVGITEALTTNDVPVINTSYVKSLTEDITSDDIPEGQFAVYLTSGEQNFPMLKGEAKRNVSFAGDARIPFLSSEASKGWGAGQTSPEFTGEATLKISFPFSHEERVPKLKGEASLKIGRAFAGDAKFPVCVADSGFHADPELTGDQDFPTFKGFATMTISGRFEDYVLRYVR